jgi:hypothetical protein
MQELPTLTQLTSFTPEIKVIEPITLDDLDNGLYAAYQSQVIPITIIVDLRQCIEEMSWTNFLRCGPIIDKYRHETERKLSKSVIAVTHEWQATFLRLSLPTMTDGRERRKVLIFIPVQKIFIRITVC